MATVTDNENAQRMGIVRIFYLLDDWYSFDYEVARQRVNVANAVPIRFAACYAIFHNSLWGQVVDCVIHMLTQFVRVRTRSICGEFYQLRSRPSARWKRQ